jgi:hypothetical protein
VKSTEHIASPASTPKAGLFASLRGLLRVQGSGALNINARRLVVSVVVTALGALAFAVPALAAAPETPSPVTVESVKASEATFRGVLNPTKEGGPGTYELGTYEFLYRKSPTECKGQGKAPEPAGISLGGGMEGVSAVAGALEPGTEYSVCLLVRNGTKGEAAVGAIEHFTTAIPPETPETLEAQNVTGSTAKLEGVLNPHTKGEPGTYTFLYRPNPTECQGAEGHGGSAAGETPEPESQEIKGLLPNMTYTYCLRAINRVGEVAVGNPQTFTTLPVAPTVTAESESATNVGSSSATLSAQVDPGGAATTFFFEYGPTAAYGSSTPVESAGAGSQPIAVRATLGGLTPDTQYHFRVVTSNAKGPPAEGLDATFSTLPTSTLGLPDGRGYELVSPLNNGNNEEVLPLYGSFSPIRAAADGGALAYLATPPAEGGNGHSGSPDPGTGAGETNFNEFLARRSAGGGWTAADIQPPSLEEAIYGSFSSDLSTGILASPEPVTEGVPPAGYRVLYSRAGDGSYRPLFTKTPSHRSAKEFSAAYAGISADSRHVLYSANDALLEGAGPQAEELNADVKQGLETQAKEYEEANTLENEGSRLAHATREVAEKRAPRVLYDSAAGGLSVVNVLPDGKIAGPAVFGSEIEFYPLGQAGKQPHGGSALGGVISGDGSRIIWTSIEVSLVEREEEPEGVSRAKALYVRENDTQPESPVAGGECTVPADACTVQIDASTLPGTVQEKEEKGGHGTFWTASADASRVFFTDDRQLTADSNAAPGEPDLYVYDFAPPAGQPHLTDLTAAVENPVEHANVAGVLGASEDGSSVYFAAAGALAAGAQPQGCVPYEYRLPNTSKCNVYVVQDGEAPKLVAAIAISDGEGTAAGSGDWVPGIGKRSSRVTPDGRHLVFESGENLTGFDSHGTPEIYMFTTATL